MTTMGKRVREVSPSARRRVLAWLALVTAAGAGIAVWQLHGGGAAKASLRTVAVTRGDIVLTVGGVGKIVAGGAAAGGAASSATGGSSAGGATVSGGGSQATAASALVGAGRAVFPQVPGHVVTVLVSPGRRVSAGQPLARLDHGTAASNLVAAQVALEQAKAQLQLDRSGVTAQSLASANASVTTARAAQVAAHQALAHALRVNRDTIAAAELQVAQARGAVASGASRGSEPQPTQAATSAVNAARQTLAAAQAALADVRAVNAQQAVTLQHSLDAAQQDLAGDQARLQRDRTTERVLADEPTGNLDSESAEEVLQLFERLHGDGSTLVVVTHSHDVAQRASRILLMADGSLVADEETARKVVLQESR